MIISKVNKKAFAQFAEKWRNTLPPARPSQGDLIVYKQLLEDLSPKPKSALILGATPELRDLLAHYRLDVSLVDFNINMIKAMSLLKESRAKEEVFVADWRESFTDLKFDSIVSDAGLNMLSWVDWPRALKSIKGMLEEDGFVLMKIAFSNPNHKRFSSKSIISKWREGKLKTPDFRWFLEMYSDYKTYNPETMVDSKAKLIEEFKRSYQKGDLTKAELEKLKIYDDKVMMTVPPRYKLDKLLEKYFKIIKVVPGKDFLYCQDMPIYLLKKK